MRDALVLQAATPTTISVLLIPQAISREEEETTNLVVFSTIASLITIPAWLIILDCKKLTTICQLTEFV
tara:strand:- start:152 stop:358 length:207 start_codon:yes stop_codon:yes gene_type:complete